MKKRNIKILVAAAILVAVCGWGIYIFYHPRIGPRTGRVIDAETGKPIQGAVVVYVWKLGGFMGFGNSRIRFETTTDNDGEYVIPGQRASRDFVLDGGFRQESVIIYRSKYAAYTLRGGWDEGGRSYGQPLEVQEHRRENNLVKLHPWKDGEPHYKHMEWLAAKIGAIAGGEKNLRLLPKELEQERKLADKEALSGN
jgi:hypothetical protein